MNSSLSSFLFVAMGFVVLAVVRGLIAFANMKPDELDENGVPKSLSKQNQMMFSRVKWQAIAVALIVILLLGKAATN